MVVAFARAVGGALASRSRSRSRSSAAGAVLEAAEQGLGELCLREKVPPSHGFDHAKKVLSNVDQALQASDFPIARDRALAIRLAALLHDADDRKYFGRRAVGLHPNAAAIMAGAGAQQHVIADAVRMIDLVSCSKNGNSAPPEARAEPELLWPRWADRLEATGEVGIVRCWQYAQETGDKLTTELTPKPVSEAEVWQHATPERLERYQASGGKSASMMDHYYDKLLQVAKPPLELVQNGYLEKEMARKAAPLVEVCLAHGKTGTVPLNEEVIAEMMSRIS